MTPSPSRVNTILLLALLFAQLLLMSGSVRRDDGTTALETGAIRMTSPFVAAGAAVAGAVRGAASTVRETWIARSENDRLRREVLDLRRESVRLREAHQQNARLRLLLDMRQEIVPRSVTATVLSGSVAGDSQVLVLDRGAADGIAPDQPVVAWGGAVGRVVTVGPRVSKVLLLSDTGSRVAGVALRGGAEGIVFGQGTGPLQMEYVPRWGDVALGDHVVTSGLDGIFPRGFTIGRVTYVSEGQGISKTIRIQPAVSFADVREALVVVDPAAAQLFMPPPAVAADAPSPDEGESAETASRPPP